MKILKSYDSYDPDVDYKKLIEDIIDNLEIKFDLITHHALFYFYKNDIKFVKVKKNKWLYINQDIRTYYRNAYDSGIIGNDIEINNSLNIHDYTIVQLDNDIKNKFNILFNENI
jgi:hypothetical protein